MSENRFYWLLQELSKRVRKLEMRALEAGLSEPLSSAEINIISRIGPDGAEKLGSIAASLGITLATLTVACDKLEERGFIRREKDPDDRRAVCVQLSEKGLTAFRFHTGFTESLSELLQRGLEHEEKNALLSAIEKLSVNLAALS
ncbi:MAG: MarR family transcriptional regulator [Clostridia bacterium]|nr:MarR family transcriptional regulator [Clostridia bacterium]